MTCDNVKLIEEILAHSTNDKQNFKKTLQAKYRLGLIACL